MCVRMSMLCVRVCAFVPVIFLLDSCMFDVRMFYGPSWSDLNKYNTICGVIPLLLLHGSTEIMNGAHLLVIVCEIYVL